MMLEEKMTLDLKNAMKSKDALKLSVLRMIKAQITNAKILKKSEVLEESEILAIIQKQAKQRRESIEIFQKAGRAELAEKEHQELAVLESYLPKQLSDEELQNLIKEAIQTAGAATKADTGKLMKVLMPKIKGLADGQRVNAAVSRLLP